METVDRNQFIKRITIISAVDPCPLPSSSLHYEFRVMPAAGPVMDRNANSNRSVATVDC